MEESLLLSLLSEGDENAYKQLFIKYYSPLTEYAALYLSDKDAEDLVQELMLYIWENRLDFVVVGSLKSYLFTATKNRCLNAIKKEQYHQRIHSLIYEKLKDEFEDPDYYLANELAEKCQSAIAKLPEKYREAFTLSRFGQMTNVQMSNKLGVSVKTIEYRIARSLNILRVKLKDYLPLLIPLLL